MVLADEMNGVILTGKEVPYKLTASGELTDFWERPLHTFTGNRSDHSVREPYDVEGFVLGGWAD